MSIFCMIKFDILCVFNFIWIRRKKLLLLFRYLFTVNNGNDKAILIFVSAVGTIVMITAFRRAADF